MQKILSRTKIESNLINLVPILISGCNGPLVGDGSCHDDLNIADCNYDGGDCCLFSHKTSNCTECECLTTGVFSSPGYPQDYSNDLDLSWIIKVPKGQYVEVNFLSFETESR